MVTSNSANFKGEMKEKNAFIYQNRYLVVKKLGKGASGKTYLVEDLVESQKDIKVLKALKCIKLDDSTAVLQQEYEKEALFLSSLKHPYILSIYESFVERSRFCLVVEYCEGGDLTNYLKQVKKRGGRINEKLIGKWLVQLILATVFIHKNKILHRDLKTSNLFLKNGNIKIGDFGISRSLSTTNELATTFIGTPYYMSPEILKYEGYNNKSDIWSIGIILYELCTQRRAFTGTNLMRVMWQVINDPCPQLPEIYSKELQEVLELMLKKVPQERPSASELLQLNIIHSYLRELYKEIIFKMKSETSDECVVDRDANPRFISFEEFINSPDLILQEQKLLQYNENLSEEADDMTEKNTENVDQYLTPRQKIKVNKATESDWTIATLRNLAEQLICSRNSLNSTKGTDLYTWQKRYPSSNHLWPTVQTSTERMLNDLRNLYLEKINEDYGITEETDNFEYTENLLWPHRPLLEGNNIPAGKGPGAEDESLGFFYSTDFVKQINNTHGQIKEQKDFMNFTAMRKFSTSCGPVYERQCIDKLTKQESITNEDNNNNVNEKEHEKITQQNLFIRRSFTIPEVASSNYNQSAGQLNKINTSRLKCNDVFSENTQLLETCYTNYDDELMNYSQRSIQENLSNSVENEKNNVEDDLEDIENQDNENTCETLDDVLCYMKAALRQSEDSNTIIMDSEAGSKYGPEAKAKKIETLRNYCIEKLGIQRFQNAYNYLYQKRITENNQSGELTILDGLKDYCSDVTTGFLLDHLIFLENDTKQTISIQPPNSVNQVLESSLQFCM